MGLLSEIDATVKKFIEAQPMFFVATAPLAADGHLNLSPKGLNAFRILGPKQVAYLDVTGSGIETVAHLRENGRIVVMFCAFSGPPRIVRLHGRGEVAAAGDPLATALSARFTERAGTRAVIRVDVERVSDSCGYGVPLMDFVRHRDNLDHWAAQKGDDGLAAYRAEKNARSLDGLPGLA